MMISDNEHLQKWFAELSMEELTKSRKIKFDMGNGYFEEMTITELIIPKVLNTPGIKI